jgi:hypothetical protein
MRDDQLLDGGAMADSEGKAWWLGWGMARWSLGVAGLRGHSASSRDGVMGKLMSVVGARGSGAPFEA